MPASEHHNRGADVLGHSSHFQRWYFKMSAMKIDLQETIVLGHHLCRLIFKDGHLKMFVSKNQY